MWGEGLLGGVGVFLRKKGEVPVVMGGVVLVELYQGIGWLPTYLGVWVFIRKGRKRIV